MRKFDFMKWAFALALGAFVFTSCSDDDDDNSVKVPDAVQSSFTQQFGDVTRVAWGSKQGGYVVADFNKDGHDYDAWFTPDGKWVMTEIDLGRDLANLPVAVREGYNVTLYAKQGWTVEDIDEIQRPDYETVYKIEVEKAGQPDHDLYFDLGGTLFKDVADQDDDDNGGMVGTQVPEDIRAYVVANYEGAVIVDFEKERDGFDVEIRHAGLSKEVRFDAAYRWVQTSTDLARNVPEAVKNLLGAKYPGKVIDDCDYVETATGKLYYLVELDDFDYELKVYPDGTITEIPD